MLMQTRFTGMIRSSPIRIKFIKTSRRSSQLSAEENSVSQSMASRYLPNSALRLARLSRFSTNLEADWLLSLMRSATVTVWWSDSPKGGKVHGSS